MTHTKPLTVGTRVRLSAFWGVYADPQEARIVDVVTHPAKALAGINAPPLVKVDPPLDGSEWWQPRDLRRVRP